MITSIQPSLLQNQKQIHKKEPSFKGAPELLATGLNLLNTNPALGAIFVDVAFMDTPRTIVDTSRNPDAGVETAAREFSSTLNHAFAGFAGLGAGWLVSQAFNKSNGVKAHMVFTNGDSLDVFGKFLEETGSSKESGKAFYKKFLQSAKGYNSTEGQGGVWKDFSQKTIEEVSELLSKAETDKYKMPKKVFTEANYKLIADIGASETFRVKAGGKEVTGRLENILNDAFSIRKAFLDKAVHDGSAAKKLTNEEFIKSLKNIKGSTAAAGLAVPIAIGMSLQPLNAYMTKKRTGKEGFVGVEGREPDKSAKFKILKTMMGAGIGGAMISTIGKFKQIPSLLQYKGLVPTIPQFKLIYGMTIFSRMMAARDKDELRESTIKDTLGFVNWLILGGFVSKIAASKLDKNLINYDEKTHGKGGWNWITKAVEKSHEEILYPALKKAGISVLDGNGKPLSYGKLMKALKEKAKSPEASADLKKVFETVNKRIKYKNRAQMLGYIYSGVVLGVGIPKLNIAITNHINKKRAQKAKENPENPRYQNSVYVQNYSSESNAFASFYGAKN